MKTLLRLPQVMARTGLTRPTIYRKIVNKEFPSPIKLGARTSVWPEHEIEQWIDEQIARGASEGE